MARDPALDVLDPRFASLVVGSARLDHLWTGGRWLEGPVYVPAARHLVFSDIPNDRTLRWDERTGQVLPFEQPARNQNGHTLDIEGRVVSCEHRSRSVTRIGHDGRTEVLAERYRGQRLNSPNDVVVASDGSIWFTDPTYGIDSDYEGDAAPSEIGASNVYRLVPGGEPEAVVTDMVQPNGLAFSPDEGVLYVADTGASHQGYEACPPIIRALPMEAGPDGSARPDSAGAKVVATCDVGAFDGFRVDAAGHIWTSAGDGVRCYHPDGDLLGRIRIPEVVANVEFGGLKRNRLYICATTSLYALYVNARAADRAH